MKNRKDICPLSPVHLAGLGAIQISIIVLFFNFKLALIPILLFLLLCITAPFMVGFSFFLPVINRGYTGKKAVALTFDDGPDPEATPAVLGLLSKYSIKATFFVTGVNASQYPNIIKEILAKGHSIGNHSYYHDPLLMLRRTERLRKDIQSTQDVLKKLGITTYAFRSPAGITNPRLRRILLELGMFCVNFSCRAFDAGNRRIDALAIRILRNVKPDDIILLHDKCPESRKDTKKLIDEIENILLGLKKNGLNIIPLSDLINKEIMTAEPVTNINPVQFFYNQHAVKYDDEQFNSLVRIAREIEYKIVISRLPKIISKSDKVLEIGAGTGIYSIPIAKICGELIAVDIADNMLKILEGKAGAERLTNIRLITADIENITIDDNFDVICSFSSFEYIKNLPSLIKSLSRSLKPGGLIYFTTANRSLFRFFTQIGNAIIQGVWLYARSKKEILNILKDAKLHPVSISSHLLKSIFSRGMVLEVLARK